MNNEGIADWLDERWLLILVLAVGLAATGYWGYDQYSTLTQINSELNNRYENAFQGLNNNVDSLEEELGALVVSDSANNLSVNLSNTWKSSHSAQEDLGSMPLNSDALDNLKGLLHNVSRYTNYLDRKVADRTLKQEEKQMLAKFRQQIKVANKDLETVHNKMEKNDFKWYNKKRINIEKGEKEYSASPLSGLAKLDGKIELTGIQDDLKSVVPDNVMQVNKQDVVTGLSELDGDEVGKEEATKIAQRYINNPEQYDYEVVDQNQVELENGRTVRANLPAHFVRATSKQDEDRVVQIDVTKKGGQVVWLLHQRDVGDKQVDNNTAKKKATEFLANNGYDNMMSTSAKSFNRVLINSFVPVQNGVLIQPDSVKVEVALDNGEVIGFNGIDYALHHEKRDSAKLEPELSKEEARKKVSNNLQLTKKPILALAEVRGEEKLCYEFIGEVKGGGKKYSVKIDAKNGEELSIKTIDDDIYTIGD
ncbi:PepSY1/2 domain-containing protein [Halanaerobaculum tunisiense]